MTCGARARRLMGRLSREYKGPWYSPITVDLVFLIFSSIPLSKGHYIYPRVYVIPNKKNRSHIQNAVLDLPIANRAGHPVPSHNWSYCIWFVSQCMLFIKTTLTPSRNRLSVRRMVLLKCHLLHALQRVLDNSHRNPILGPRTSPLPSLLT